jgi:hypothetical protein
MVAARVTSDGREAEMATRTLSYVRRHHVAYLALFVALGGTTYAATVPRNSVGRAQLKKNAVTSVKVKNGSLRGVDFAAGELPQGERGPAGPAGAVGPRGPQGVRGATGARGPSDAYTTFFGNVAQAATASPFELASQDLPAGEFLIYANFSVRNVDADNAAHSLTCGLYFDGDAGNVEQDNSLDYAQVTMGAGEQHMVSMTGPAGQDGAGAITLTCYTGGPEPAGDVQINDIDIGATQVGALR